MIKWSRVEIIIKTFLVNKLNVKCNDAACESLIRVFIYNFPKKIINKLFWIPPPYHTTYVSSDSGNPMKRSRSVQHPSYTNERGKSSLRVLLLAKQKADCLTKSNNNMELLIRLWRSPTHFHTNVVLWNRKVDNNTGSLSGPLANANADVTECWLEYLHFQTDFSNPQTLSAV